MTQTSDDAPTLAYADRTQPSRAAPRLAWIDPLVCGAIFVAGLAAIDGWPRSFVDAGTRIALAAPAAALLAAVAAATRVSLVSALATVLAIAACVLPTAWPKHDNGSWPAATLAIVGVGIVAAFTVVAGTLNALRADRGERVLTSLLPLGMTGATVGLLVFTGSARSMERTIPLAIVLAIALVVGAIWRGRLASVGVTAFAVSVIAGQLVTGWLWSDLLPWQAATVAVAPLIAWALLTIPAVRRLRRAWLRVPLVLIIAALPALFANGVAGYRYWHEWQSTGSGNGTDDGSAYYGT